MVENIRALHIAVYGPRSLQIISANNLSELHRKYFFLVGGTSTT